jgi:uncharacterized protein (DUF2062 family)
MTDPQKPAPTTPPAPASAPASNGADAPKTPPRPWWKRYFLDPVLVQLTQGVTPDKIAFTIAIGTGIGMFPLVGPTTWLALLAGIIFRLNQPLTQLVTHSILPLHLASIYFCIRWGETLFGAQPAQLGGVRALARHINHLFWTNQAQFWHDFGLLIFHAIIVWIILVPFWTLLMYFILRPMIRALNRWKLRVTTAKSTPSA